MPAFSPRAAHVLSILCAAFLVSSADQVAAEPTAVDPAFLERARRILSSTPLIDGHNDLPEQLRDRFANHLEKAGLDGDTSGLQPPMHTDLPRLRRGMVGGQFWAVYVPSDSAGPAGVQLLLEQIDVVARMTARYPDILVPALTADDVERIHRSGRIASLIGIEGGQAIGNSLAVLRLAHSLGARYMTLTHWGPTDWADAATSPARHHGLTAFGREVVREMNRLGMMVDLSHVSDEVMRQVLEFSEAPPIFSHSSARAVCNHPRNVPDDILRATAARKGIVMVNFAPGFISAAASAWDERAWPEYRRQRELHSGDRAKVREAMEAWRRENPAPRVTVADVADHIDHIRRVAGIDHVGLGSDFDGISLTPEGLDDVSFYPHLIAELLRRGYTDEEVRKVAGLNILRVMRAVEASARAIQRTRPASEALIEDLDPKPLPVEHSPRGSR
ncbi:MAG: dipeptidase [Acidobacteriota bacterium]